MDALDRDRLVSKIRLATEEVFSTMLGTSAIAEAEYVEQGGSQCSDGMIALVGLAGAWAGAGIVCCSAALACRLSGALLDSEHPGVSEDVLDAMSELANMIVGHVKSSLEDELGPLGLSIPTVIFGRNIKARSGGAHEWVVAPFRCHSELLEVKIALMPSGRTGNSRAFATHEAH